MEAKPDRPAIRLAVPDDADGIVALRWKLLVTTGRDEDTATRSTYGLDYGSWLRRVIAQGSYTGWLGVPATGEPVAMVGLWITEWQPTLLTPDLKQGNAVNVYTEPDYRGLGLASTMMTMLIEECRKQGVKKLSLHASQYGRPLYETLGFKQTNEMRLEILE
jgi:GNAT superfamily N-acetyltransferase